MDGGAGVVGGKPPTAETDPVAATELRRLSRRCAAGESVTVAGSSSGLIRGKLKLYRGLRPDSHSALCCLVGYSPAVSRARSISLSPWFSPAALMTLTLGLGGCSGCSGDDLACVEPQPSDCQPLYQPVFDEVFARTIEPRCALSGGACHSASGAKGGLRLDTADVAYEHLVDQGRVVPGDASCSLMVIRIEGGGGVMPPGTPLSEAERCAVETWVANGAKR